MKQSGRDPLRHLQTELDALDHEGLLRRRLLPSTARRTFCSNDYLGLADRSSPPGVASGAGASRLVSGEHPEHALAERALAEWLQVPAALLFTSGYAANVSTLAAMAGPDDLVVSDALNHASLIDGARLSRASVRVIPHLDLDAAREALGAPRRGRAWLVTESYFSMDADAPDLRALRALANVADAALVVDEAHALGVFGPAGRGLCAEAGVKADVLIGTFGKAFGAAGAFVAGSEALTAWLWNRARAFVFSTGLSPALAATVRANLRVLAEDESLRRLALENAAAMRDILTGVGLAPGGFGHIVPCILGDARRALAFSAALLREGIDVPPIRPPSVPMGTARLRFTANANQTAADLERFRDAVTAAAATAALIQ